MSNAQECWLQITSGRGPDECAYFVGKLLEIILAEALQANLETQVIDEIAGEQSQTYLSVLISVRGENCLTFVAQWQGTVQWICKSPFRPYHKRKNWFVGVNALTVPEISGRLSEKEVKFNTMRSSGPGGQNVNKTETAVRVTHLPTGITVTASEERSQYLNKKLALAKLAFLLETNEREALAQLDREGWTKHNELERGNSIRIYEGKNFKIMKS